MKTSLTLILAIALVFTASAADPVAGEKLRVIGYVLNKTDDGLLIICKAAPRAIGVKHAKGTVFLKGHPQQAALVDKANINCLATVTGIHEYTTVLKAHATVQELTFEK
jgi:ABC-type enterochelin transport system substrate-binding protein